MFFEEALAAQGAAHAPGAGRLRRLPILTSSAAERSAGAGHPASRRDLSLARHRSPPVRQLAWPFGPVRAVAKAGIFPKAVDDGVSAKRFAPAMNSALAKPDRID
ncbi:hypothetical protein [Bosea sp. ASV33]|uniref:hypothetical protein n=1 Tax=Bosea sp. ASV33 TaxID=2795106 RepID=UPI0018EE0B11|nr:hypothetical protein [Bosea sp. ASV33]